MYLYFVFKCFLTVGDVHAYSSNFVKLNIIVEMQLALTKPIYNFTWSVIKRFVT